MWSIASLRHMLHKIIYLSDRVHMKPSQCLQLLSVVDDLVGAGAVSPRISRIDTDHDATADFADDTDMTSLGIGIVARDRLALEPRSRVPVPRYPVSASSA